MPRCPDCGKFVSVEMAEPEMEELVVDAEGNVSGSVRLVQECGECGTELAEANIDVEATVTVEHKDGCKGESGLVSEDEATESKDRFEGKGRYAKHFYGADITATIRCEDCGAEASLETSVEEQAIFFESLV